MGEIVDKGRIILKWILEKKVTKLLVGFIFVTFNVFFMAVTLIYVLWNVTSCSLVDRYRY